MRRAGSHDDRSVHSSGAETRHAAACGPIGKGVNTAYRPERTIDFPKSPTRGDRRGGGTNSLTRLKLKPVLMVGGYAQHCYRFNDYGPPASDRDSYVIVRKLEGPPRW